MRFNAFLKSSSRAACIISIAAIAFAAHAAPRCDGQTEAARQCETSPQAQALVADCLSTDQAVAAASIARLRELGQPGLDAVCDAIASEESQLKPPAPSGPVVVSAAPSSPRLERLRKAADAVARQRDAASSRLYWHTDYDAAVAAAKLAGRPILTLRLLGDLDEDLSCANSRFFRTTLYANAEVAAYLRERFILHWQSLRPVPRISIDLGDGRRIERTITGNSIHYVLTPDGALVDALPGLYGPAAFLRGLRAAEAAAAQAAKLEYGSGREEYLRGYHRDALAAIDVAYAADTSRLAQPAIAAGPIAAPAAVRAAPIGMTKMEAEAPMLKATLPPPADGEALWERLGALHADDAALDQASMALMRTKMPEVPAEQAARIAMSKRRAEDPFMKAMHAFQRSLAADTVRNEYLIHREIHARLANQDDADVKAFNARVYADLFLTPLDDPWMGLAPSDVYAAIDKGGLVMTCP